MTLHFFLEHLTGIKTSIKSEAVWINVKIWNLSYVGNVNALALNPRILRDNTKDEKLMYTKTQILKINQNDRRWFTVSFILVLIWVRLDEV